MSLILGTIPGFVDLPDALLAANKYAMGLYFQRLLGNAKFGIVRPEVFVAQYKHGDTVDVPTSPVDGYRYQRDELIYLWHFVWSGAVTSTSLTDPITNVTTTTLTANAPSGPGPVWYFEAFVDQATGIVSSYVKYRISDNTNTAAMSNDGMVEVFTIGVRRKCSLMVSATLPAWSDLADSVFAQDAAVTETLTLALNHNAKLASLEHEAIFMGEFTNAQQVPLPVSPVDGYAYAYSEVTWAWSWRWCSISDAFGDPIDYDSSARTGSTIYLNLLQRVTASIDATGHVSTQTVFWNDHESYTNYGRLTVVAFCQRHPLTVSASANVFSDIADSNLQSGAFPKLDVLKAIDDAIRFAALRVEWFTADCVNGATVALPTSPVDGYAYAREELAYHYDFGNTGPNSHIRLASFGASINQSTGAVKTVTNHCLDGGSFKAASDGTVHVLIVARRAHVQPSGTDISIAIDGGGSGGDLSAELYNGGFEWWSRAGQAIADGWTLGAQGTGATFSQAAGIEGSFAQGFSVPAGSSASVYSSKLDSKAGDLRYCGLKLAANVATIRGCFLRVHLYNQDLANTAYFDVLSDQAALGSGTLQKFDLWYEVPPKNATAANTSRGSAAITGTYDFVCTYAKLEILCSNPDVAVQLAADSINWGVQANASAGQISLRGSLALAFFPAIALSITDTTVSFPWPALLEFSDGRIITSTATVAIGGLTAATVYALELFWDDIRGVYGAVAGGVGTNGWAHNPTDMAANARTLAMTWSITQNAPLSSGPIYFTTNAAGVVTPVGGSGGGDGGCHRSDVLVKEQCRGIISHRNLLAGNRLWSRSGFTEVIEVETLPHEEWIHADFDNGVLDLPMTTGHTFNSADGCDLRAHDLSAATLLRTPTGVTSPTRIQRRHYEADIVRVRLAEPCTYYVSMDGLTWIESHNSRIIYGPTM